MGLRLKAIVFLGGAIVLAVAGLSALLSHLNQRNFGDLERREISHDLSRAVNSIRAELRALEITAMDWSIWDSAFDYMKKPNPEFEASSLDATNLGTIDLEYLILKDTQGKVVYGRQRTAFGNYSPVQNEASQLTQSHNWIWVRSPNFFVEGGVASFGNRLYLVATSPIIPSSRFAKAAGHITMVRRLDWDLISRLGERTQIRFNLLSRPPVGADAGIVGLFDSAATAATPPDEIRLPSASTAKGYRVLNTPDSEPPLVLELEFSRDIYRLGQQSNWQLLLTIMGFGLAMLGVVLGLLERGILSRLHNLSHELSQISASGESGLRVTVSGTDELTTVARNINAGLLQIENTQIHAVQAEAELERFQRIAAEELLYRQNVELDAVQFEMYERLALVAEFRDDETAQHTLRVGELSSAVALRLGMSKSDCQNLRFAARLHDIGKIAIPDAILLKTGKLTQNEWELMKEHALIGAKMLEGSHSPVLEMAYEIALTHHERWDGQGYPNRLKEQQIPLVGRIVSVADCLDALINSRPYKEAWPLEKALEEIKNCANTRYDPQVVEAFLEVLKDQPSRLHTLNPQLDSI